MLLYFTSTADIYVIFVFLFIANEINTEILRSFLIEKHFVLRLNLCQFRKVAPDLRKNVGRRAILKIILRDGGGVGEGDCSFTILIQQSACFLRTEAGPLS
jgi:hypothetical protein